ncbi:MAG TPA: hypothetical protein VGJ86_15965 [Acidimicrobiales bacterium]|jgi:hypothetical protein
MIEEGDQHACPLAWLVQDVGRYLTDDDADEAEVDRAGRDAVQQGSEQVSRLLRSAFAAHEVVATELRITGPRRDGRRTVFADEPTPVALLLLCLQLCDIGDEVALLQHTAAPRHYHPVGDLAVRHGPGRDADPPTRQRRRPGGRHPLGDETERNRGAQASPEGTGFVPVCSRHLPGPSRPRLVGPIAPLRAANPDLDRPRWSNGGTY